MSDVERAFFSGIFTGMALVLALVIIFTWVAS